MAMCIFFIPALNQEMLFFGKIFREKKLSWNCFQFGRFVVQPTRYLTSDSCCSTMRVQLQALSMKSLYLFFLQWLR